MGTVNAHLIQNFNRAKRKGASDEELERLSQLIVESQDRCLHDGARRSNMWGEGHLHIKTKTMRWYTWCMLCAKVLVCIRSCDCLGAASMYHIDRSDLSRYRVGYSYKYASPVHDCSMCKGEGRVEMFNKLIPVRKKNWRRLIESDSILNA